jgi:tetratricopeptide (TPR) repeat protein
LAVLGRAQARLEMTASALDTNEESLSLTRKLCEDRPGQHAAELAVALVDAAYYRFALGHPVSRCLTIAHEAVDLLRKAALHRPEAGLYHLSVSLAEFSLYQAAAVQDGAAVISIEEAITLQEEIRLRFPSHSRVQHASILYTGSKLYKQAGNQEKANACYVESLALAKADPESRETFRAVARLQTRRSHALGNEQAAASVRADMLALEQEWDAQEFTATEADQLG